MGTSDMCVSWRHGEPGENADIFIAKKNFPVKCATLSQMVLSVEPTFLSFKTNKIKKGITER
jgi:hypothetical protein